MSEKKEVALTELEYFKLLRYIEGAVSIKAQFELMVGQAKEKIKQADDLRDSYFQSLQATYPDLDPDGNYGTRESDFTLVPA